MSSSSDLSDSEEDSELQHWKQNSSNSDSKSDSNPDSHSPPMPTNGPNRNLAGTSETLSQDNASASSEESGLEGSRKTNSENSETGKLLDGLSVNFSGPSLAQQTDETSSSLFDHGSKSAADIWASSSKGNVTAAFYIAPT